MTKLDYAIQPVERYAIASSLQPFAASVSSPPRRVTFAEAIRIANANFSRVEALLTEEVSRDASGTAVWEEE